MKDYGAVISDSKTTLYDFSVLDIDKKTQVDLSDYRGKVCLVVNVASY